MQMKEQRVIEVEQKGYGNALREGIKQSKEKSIYNKNISYSSIFPICNKCNKCLKNSKK